MINFRCLLVLWVLATAFAATSRDLDSGNAGIHTIVECSLVKTQVDSLIYDEIDQVYRKAGAEKLVLLGGSGGEAVSVKECWCSRVLGRTDEYCASQFDTCQVQGAMGDVLCFSNTAKLNVIRGMWPFCLFWCVALLYLWIASEPGRRARGYLHRQTSNAFEHLKDTFHGQETTTTTYSAGPGTSSSASAAAPEPSSDEEVAQQSSNSDPPPVEGGTITDTEQPVSTNSAAADRVIPSSSPTDAAATTNTRTTTSASLTPESYPSEFGSRTNYVHLLKELYGIHRYEPERMLRLLHSAWHHERRRHEEDQIIQQRRPGQLQQQLQGELQPASPVTISFWWTAQPTIELSLKTKRFEDDDVEDNVDNDGEDSLEEGEKEKTCAICLAEIEHGDIVGDIPCNHLFHKDCLKSWLRRSNRCPLCQKEGIASRKQSVALPPLDANGEDQ
jgi:hypothetical protein